MANVFVSHTGDDSQTALRLADLLSERGHSSWYFERDSLPGISYLLQCQEAISESKTFLILISKASVKSHEVARELELAHRQERMILPVLVDLDQTEIKRAQPSWELMIGSAVSVSLTTASLEDIAQRVAESLKVFSVEPDLETSGKLTGGDGRSVPAQCRSVRWASDAYQIEIGDLKSVVFENQLLSDFLQRREKFFLSANKGLGKTLLLTFKRSLLTEEFGSGNRSDAAVHFVPEGRPFLDFMGDLRTLGSSLEQFFQTLGNAKRVWGLALRMSALSFHADLMNVDELQEIKAIPKSYHAWLCGGKVEPTIVFKELCGLTVRNLNRLLDEADNFFERRLRMIHGGMYFFVDKVDQALRNVSRDTWIHVQAGLLEAAWDEMNANRHLKIYASIRQEAFSNYESPLKTNLYGALTSIEYSEADMRDLLDMLARYYEGGKTFQELTRLNVVRHPHRAFPEDAFSYLRRHTFGRPRDLVIIASEISHRQQQLNEPLFRETVSETAANVLVPNVFEEMSVFLRSLASREERLRFLSLLPHNVMREEEMIDICYRFNGLSVESFDFFGDDANAISHPFSELHRVGLLGVIREDHDGTGACQHFRQPSDLLLDVPMGLPESPFYLIHPALDRYIIRHRVAGKYRVFQHLLVGHREPWLELFETLWNAEKTMYRIPEQETKSDCHRVIKEFVIAWQSGRRDEMREVCAASKTWQRLQKLRARQETVDEFLLWLEDRLGEQDSRLNAQA